MVRMTAFMGMCNNYFRSQCGEHICEYPGNPLQIMDRLLVCDSEIPAIALYAC